MLSIAVLPPLTINRSKYRHRGVKHLQIASYAFAIAPYALILSNFQVIKRLLAIIYIERR